MKLIFTSIFISLSIVSFAQDNNPLVPNPTERTAIAEGTITVPTFTNIGLSTHSVNTGFTTWEDMIHGKIYPGVMSVIVKSNVPWIVKVKSNSEFFIPPAGGSTDVSASLMSLKTSTTGVFIPMSTTAQTLLMSNNSNCQNSYPLDVRIMTNWNSIGGIYTL
ncbi:MAG TPA: hypothetical protein VEB40_07620, partial [Flavipsychrobacter sp.]|nr:hypothetical protein [Flavipsychrobacter sp.]